MNTIIRDPQDRGKEVLLEWQPKEGTTYVHTHPTSTPLKLAIINSQEKLEPAEASRAPKMPAPRRSRLPWTRDKVIKEQLAKPGKSLLSTSLPPSRQS